MLFSRSEEEIDDLANRVVEAVNSGSNFPGMSYEEGINAMIEWLENPDASDPLEG
jgi:hypothetical protein